MKSLTQFINEEKAEGNFVVVGAFYYSDGSDDVEYIGCYSDHDSAQKALDKWWGETNIKYGEEGVDKKNNCYSAYLNGGDWCKARIINV